MTPLPKTHKRTDAITVGNNCHLTCPHVSKPFDDCASYFCTRHRDNSDYVMFLKISDVNNQIIRSKKCKRINVDRIADRK